mgnify:CR=1 FL=1
MSVQIAVHARYAEKFKPVGYNVFLVENILMSISGHINKYGYPPGHCITMSKYNLPLTNRNRKVETASLNEKNIVRCSIYQVLL